MVVPDPTGDHERTTADVAYAAQVHHRSGRGAEAAEGALAPAQDPRCGLHHTATVVGHRIEVVAHRRSADPHRSVLYNNGPGAITRTQCAGDRRQPVDRCGNQWIDHADAQTVLRGEVPAGARAAVVVDRIANDDTACTEGFVLCVVRYGCASSPLIVRGIVHLHVGHVGGVAPSGDHVDQTIAPYGLHLIIDRHGDVRAIGHPCIGAQVQPMHAVAAQLERRPWEHMIAADHIGRIAHHAGCGSDLAQRIRHIRECGPTVRRHIIAVSIAMDVALLQAGCDAAECVHIP